MTLIQPTEEQFFSDNGMQLDRTNDLTFEWSSGDHELPVDGPVADQFTAFVSVDSSSRMTIEYLCIGAASNSTHTIPAALFE